MIYLENSKTVELLTSPQTISASSGYDGFMSLVVTLEEVDIDNVELYVGDYVNDTITFTTGSLDTYNRRIYVA